MPFIWLYFLIVNEHSSISIKGLLNFCIHTDTSARSVWHQTSRLSGLVYCLQNQPVANRQQRVWRQTKLLTILPQNVTLTITEDRWNSMSVFRSLQSISFETNSNALEVTKFEQTHHPMTKSYRACFMPERQGRNNNSLLRIWHLLVLISSLIFPLEIGVIVPCSHFLCQSRLYELMSFHF